MPEADDAEFFTNIWGLGESLKQATLELKEANAALEELLKNLNDLGDHLKGTL